MASEEVNSASICVSELPQLSSLADNAYIVIERGSTSYKISYADFKTSVFNELDRIMDIGSIAYRDKEEYAKFAHGHDYTDFWFFPSYGPQSKHKYYDDKTKKTVDYTNAQSCDYYGQFDIVKYLPGQNKSQTSHIGVYAPKFQTLSSDETLLYNSKRVGDIQPLAIACSFETYLTSYRGYKLKTYNGVKNIDIDDPSFDGYVIPNGVTFSCSPKTFQQACRAYSPSRDAEATSFTVPNLTAFIKGNPGLQLEDAMQSVPFNNAMPSHNHLSTLSDGSHHQIEKSYSPLNLDLKNFYQFASKTDGFADEFLHGCKASMQNGSKKATLTLKKLVLDAYLSGIECQSVGQNEESYPNHNKIPVLLYIGEK